MTLSYLQQVPMPGVNHDTTDNTFHNTSILHPFLQTHVKPIVCVYERERERIEESYGVCVCVYLPNSNI